MQVLVKCVIFDGRATPAGGAEPTPRIARVRDGQVLGAWRAVEGRIGFALLDVSSMAMVPNLLKSAFPGSRHIDIDEVVAVDTISLASHFGQSLATGEARQTGA